MLDISELRRAIAANAGNRWEAAETPLFRMLRNNIDLSGRFGLVIRPEDKKALREAASAFAALTAAPARHEIDWRTERGGHVTPVKDQEDCGSCVAFATCASMEAVHSIQAREVIDLSEAHLFFCNGGDCDNGWYFEPALEAAEQGIGVEGDLPYAQRACVEISPYLKVKSYRVRSHLNDRKRALLQGPVIGGMRVYEDFLAYTQGVYQHVAGEFCGNHAICVVGYNDDEECWIAKNSWGTGFGEAGFFRIGYGQCGIDDDTAFFSLEVQRA